MRVTVPVFLHSPSSKYLRNKPLQTDEQLASVALIEE
jgi:hypothetical protein